MSCECNRITNQGKQYCQECMPDEFHWLVPVSKEPDPFLMDRNHAYIDQNSIIYILSRDRLRAIKLTTSEGNVDLSPYALKEELASKISELTTKLTEGLEGAKYFEGEGIRIDEDNRIHSTVTLTKVNQRLDSLEQVDTSPYKAGTGIEITPDLTINSTVDVSGLDSRVQTLEEKEDKDTTYTAGNGLTLNDTEFSIDDTKVATQQELEETNAQLAQIASVTTMGILNEEIPLTNKTRINTYGFYEASSNRQFSYAVVENTTLENWVDTGNGYEINEEMALKVNNNVKLVPLFKDEIKAGAVGLEGDSDIVFQMLLDYAYKNQINIDMTGCKVTISNTIFLNKPQYPRKLLLIKNGWIAKENGGLLFDSPPENAGSGGGYRFVDTVFEGVEDTELTLFDSKIIRVYLDACEFYNVDNVFKSFANNHYLQSIYVTNAYIVGGKGHVFDSFNGYDILFDSSLVEHRANYMRIDTPHSVRTTNSVIEGMTGYVYRGKYGRSLVFDDNYFEANCTDTNEPYFKFTDYNGHVNPFSVSMQSNLIQGNGIQQNNPDFYMVEFDGVPNTISFNGTWSNCNLVKVTKIRTLTNKKLRKMLSAHTGDKKVVNEWGNVDVLEGSGTRIPLATYSGLGLFTQVGVGEVKYTANGIMFTTQELNTVGIELKTGVLSHQYTYYVVGLYLSNYQQLSRGYFTTTIIDSNDTIIQEYRIPLSEIAPDENFLSLPPVYTSSVPGRLKIRLSTEDTSGGNFILKSLVFQQGTIANPHQIYG